MGFDVLDVFGLAAIDVAWDVEIEVVLFDLLDADHAGVFGDFETAVEDIDDFVDVHGAETVLVAVLEEAGASIDDENAFAGVGVFLVDDYYAGGDAGAIKEVGRQADDALEIALAHEGAPNVGLGVAAEEDAVRENACTFAVAPERADDVEEVGVIALLGGRDAEALEAQVGVVAGIDAVAPGLVAEGRIGDYVVEGFDGVAVLEFWIGQRVALLNVRPRVVVEDHVHAGETGGGGVLFLPVEGDLGAGFVTHFEEEGAGAAGGVVDGGTGGGGGVADADDLGHDAGDLGGGVELAFALAAFGGEVAHEVFVGVTQDVVAVGAVLAEVEGGVFEYGDQVGEAVHLFFAAAELVAFVEVGHVGEAVGFLEWRDDFLVDLVADVGLAL